MEETTLPSHKPTYGVIILMYMNSSKDDPRVYIHIYTSVRARIRSLNVHRVSNSSSLPPSLPAVLRGSHSETERPDSTVNRALICLSRGRCKYAVLFVVYSDRIATVVLLLLWFWGYRQGCFEIRRGIWFLYNMLGKFYGWVWRKEGRRIIFFVKSILNVIIYIRVYMKIF